MPATPPAADSKKPVTPPPAKDNKEQAQQAQKSQQTQNKQQDKTATTDTSKTAQGQQHFNQLAVRAKMAVSEPGDAVEREADQIADKVMRMPEPAAKQRNTPQQKNTPTQEKRLQRKAEPTSVNNQITDEIRRKENGATPPDNTQHLMQNLGAGEPLDSATRAYFEQRMGADLSQVRIHTDAAAAKTAQQLAARAFTYGQHIAFAPQQYQPQSEAGKHLLAHELAHVVQQADGNIARQIMRAPGAGTGGDFEVTHAELEVPPIKARHVGGYRALADKGQLKRKGAYDASTRGTKQVGLWTGGVKPDINKIPDKRRPNATTGFNLNLELAGGATSKTIKANSLDELTRLLQIPTWDNAGKDIEFQVDHMVEYQLGGADALDNMELLNQTHNGSVGSSFSHGIKRTVREEIQAEPTKPVFASYTGPKNASGEPTAEGVMEAMTVVFKKVKGRARESKRQEGGSLFWSKEQIENLDHVLPRLGGSGDLTGDATNFALLSPTGNLLVGRYSHGSSQNTITVPANLSGGMAGFKLKQITLNAAYNDAAAGSNIGNAEGELNFGPAVAIPKGNVSIAISQAQSPGKYSGKLGTPTGSGLPNQVDFKPMSPLLLNNLTFGTSVFGQATLQPSHPALSGLSIPAQIQDGKLGLFYTVDATALASKLNIPGVKIDSAGITLGYDGDAFSVTGGTEFTIQKFGTGYLNAMADTAGDFQLEGGLRADKRLFDQADMKLWYRKKGGFGGKGTLAITTPGKIKGIKSARLTAEYNDSVFSATGDVIPDIPGLKAASLSVTYANNELDITGKLGIDDKIPGVQSADITVNVKQANDTWKVAASGEVTPKLPALSGAKLQFSYNDDFVLLEGEFKVDKGPISGKLKAGVTNATVDDKGVRSDKGSGNKFSVFGAAEVDAIFIKDKLAGKLKLRLLPDGSTRVGGELKVGDFDVFPQIPKDGGQFLNKEINSPRIPLPGAGFSVGSMSVGVTFWASGHIKAYASIGPGKMSAISVNISEFDPANIDLNKLEIGGKAKFATLGSAGVEVGASVNVGLSAAVVDLVGSLGITGSVGIPKNTAILTATSQFTYSQNKGLDIGANCNLDISPNLAFALKGGFAAKLNLYVDTVTIWSKDWTLAEANFKLPVGISANGELRYNSKTNKLSADPASAIKVKTPEFSSDDFKRILTGSPAPDKVENISKDGTPIKRRVQDRPQHQHPANTIAAHDLGNGFALDRTTREFFESRLQTDLSQVQIHTDSQAAQQAERLSARAFTIDQHIVFAPGEYQPDTQAGQELLAHELAHVTQQSDQIRRWPAVTRTTARTSETPASIRAMSLSEFDTLTQTQLDWATSSDLQADPAALAQFRNIQQFAAGPNIVPGCGAITVGAIITKGIPAVYPALNKYSEGAASRSTAWLRRTDDIDKAERWGNELNTLEAAWPAANLSRIMPAPDPVSNDSSFEKLDNPARPELTNFINYLNRCTPIMSANNGAEIDSFLELRGEGVMPTAYLGQINHVKNYHHFTKLTLDGLVTNEAIPQLQQYTAATQRPLTAVLYPSVDHNGAFHRNAGLQAMVQRGDILTIVIEGQSSVADYQSALAPVASRYGRNGQIQQAMIGGHGNYNVIELAGSMNGADVDIDALGTRGDAGTRTTDLIHELNRLMSTDPRQRRIVLDACLTNSHLVTTPLSATPATAAAEINNAISTDPSLRDVVATAAGPGFQVFGANASFAPSSTDFLISGSTNVGLSVPSDPDVIASKLQYVEFGTEPEGCMRAVLECWADDQLHGTTRCREAIERRILATRSTHVQPRRFNPWRENIIQPLYHLAIHHYWGNGEALRQMSFLAGSLFELYWPQHTSAHTLQQRLAPLAGNAAHVDQLFTPLSTGAHYTATPRVAIVVEQAWMQHNPARRANFTAALARYSSCLQASEDVDMNLVMPHLNALLTLPPANPPPAELLRLALLAAHHAPVARPAPRPLPRAIAWLRHLRGAGPSFPDALDIDGALGGLCSATDILADIGFPLNDPHNHDEPPAANIDTTRDATMLNDFHVTPRQGTGQVITIRDPLMVRSTPSTANSSNIFNRLAPGTAVTIIGEYRQWYAIEQPGRTGFVAKRYIRILP